MPDRKYIHHSAEDCFIKRTNQNTINYGLVVHMGSKSEALKQYNNYESKWNKHLKALKKQNKMLSRIVKKSSLRYKLKKIKNIRTKASKKCCNFSNNSSDDNLDYDFSLSSDSD